MKVMKDRMTNVKRAVWPLVIILVFLTGALSGIGYDRSRQKLDLTTFWDVYNHINTDYVHPLDETKASEGAARGLVESLGDQFSYYMSAAEKKSFDEELSGQFEGIGAELSQRDGATSIVTPIAGSPAERAGLKAKDIIISVDDKSTEGKTLNEVVSMIRGAKGTQVKIALVRESTRESLTFTITRDKIEVKSVTSRMIGSVGYLEITQFGDDTVSLSQAEVKSLMEKKPKAIIIDLRNNPGGYLNSVPPVAGLFLPPSVVVKEKDRTGKVQELRSLALPLAPDVPLYVLINGGSASAAEILTGALQDYGRAKIVGEKSFGKGSVQDPIDLPNGASLHLTIAEWLTPKDRAINKVGIEPDVKVVDAKTDTEDPVLAKALELANQ